MANTRTKQRHEAERQRSAPKGPRWRRKPWYRRGQAWNWIISAVAAGGLTVFLMRVGDGPSSPTRPYVGGDLHSLVADPADASRLFVGGHGGVAVSTDDGATWRQITTLDGADAMGWAFTDEAILVGGHPGLFVSRDGGRTFAQENEGLPATDIHGLGAGEGVIYGASPAAGLLASTDGGESWEIRSEEAGRSFMGPILVDPEDPKRLLAPDMQVGVVESTNGGRSWRVLGGMPGAMWLTWDPQDTEHVIASGAGQAVETTDAGKTWTQIEVPTGAMAVELQPTGSGTLYAAVHEGTEAVVWLSGDGGATWKKT